MAHRKHHEGESGGVNLGLVITPMLDMSFQLLAFFIMTYHPSALEAHIDGKLLPAAKVLYAGPPMGEKKDDTPPPDEEPNVKFTVRVIVRAVGPGQREGDRGEGQPSKILLKIPDAAEPETVADAGTSLKAGLEKLKARLTELRDGQLGSKMNVTIDADPNLRYGYFIQVQDTCKAARFENIGFAAPLPAGQ
jgi:biopolymer transport protein ExbD